MRTPYPTPFKRSPYPVLRASTPSPVNLPPFVTLSEVKSKTPPTRSDHKQNTPKELQINNRLTEN